MTHSAIKPFMLALESFATEDLDTAPSIEWTVVQITDEHINTLKSLRNDLLAHTKVREFVGEIKDFGLKMGFFPALDSRGDAFDAVPKDITIRRETIHFHGVATDDQTPFESWALNLNDLTEMLCNRVAGHHKGKLVWVTEHFLICTSLAGNRSHQSIANTLAGVVLDGTAGVTDGESQPYAEIAHLVRAALPEVGAEGR